MTPALFKRLTVVMQPFIHSIENGHKLWPCALRTASNCAQTFQIFCGDIMTDLRHQPIEPIEIEFLFNGVIIFRPIAQRPHAVRANHR